MDINSWITRLSTTMLFQPLMIIPVWNLSSILAAANVSTALNTQTAGLQRPLGIRWRLKDEHLAVD
jgi:hypothetical protein